jgi:hypothetical protein
MAEISTTDLWGSAKQADALPANVAAAAPAALRRVSVERVSVNSPNPVKTITLQFFRVI